MFIAVGVTQSCLLLFGQPLAFKLTPTEYRDLFGKDLSFGFIYTILLHFLLYFLLSLWSVYDCSHRVLLLLVLTLSLLLQLLRFFGLRIRDLELDSVLLKIVNSSPLICHALVSRILASQTMKVVINSGFNDLFNHVYTFFSQS